MIFEIFRERKEEELELLEVFCIELELHELIINPPNVLLQLAIEELFHFILCITQLIYDILGILLILQLHDLPLFGRQILRLLHILRLHLQVLTHGLPDHPLYIAEGCEQLHQDQ